MAYNFRGSPFVCSNTQIFERLQTNIRRTMVSAPWCYRMLSFARTWGGCHISKAKYDIPWSWRIIQTALMVRYRMRYGHIRVSSAIPFYERKEPGILHSFKKLGPEHTDYGPIQIHVRPPLINFLISNVLYVNLAARCPLPDSSVAEWEI